MERLPNEVLLSVFENHDYMDLQRSIPLVNCHFNAVLESYRTTSSELKLKLYKDIPALDEKNIPNEAQFHLHPAFKEIGFSPLDSEDVVTSNPTSSRAFIDYTKKRPNRFRIIYPAYPPANPKARLKLGNRIMISILKSITFRGHKEISSSRVCRENALFPAVGFARLKFKGAFGNSERGVGIYGPSLVEKQPGASTVYGLWDYILLTVLVCVEKGYYSPVIKKWVRGGFGIGDTTNEAVGGESNTPDDLHFVHEFSWLGFEGVTTKNGEVNITVRLRFEGVTAVNTTQATLVKPTTDQ